MTEKKLVTVGELGSSSHCFIHGEFSEEGSLSRRAWSLHPSAGCQQGHVTDVEQMAHSLRATLSDLTEQTGHQVSQINVLGISLDAPFSVCSRGVTEIRQGVVHPYDVESVMISAQTVNLPDDYKLIHVIPMYYEVDHQMRVIDPVGLSGKRLEGCFHLLAVPKALIENHKKVFADLSISVDQMVLSSVCTKHVTSLDEYHLMIDFGWHSTRAVIYQQGACVAIVSAPLGGAHVDHDLSVCCEMSKLEAEQLKIKFMQKEIPKRMGAQDELIFRIIEARYEEIIGMLCDKISAQIDLSKGIKVTGFGGGYQPIYVNPLIRDFMKNSSIVHPTELGNGVDHLNWLAFQLFDYACEKNNQDSYLKNSSMRQLLRRCKRWFEYHF